MQTQTNAIAGAKRRSGFSIIEMMAALALMMFIVAILAESFQQGLQVYRELAARDRCEKNLRQIALAMRDYHNRYKRFPANLDDAFRAADFPATGEKDGYKFGPSGGSHDPTDGWILAATPEAGVTGSESAELRVFLAGGVPYFTIEFTPTPGASQGRARMFAAVRYHAAEAFAQLAYALPSSERDYLYRQVRTYVESSAVAEDALRTLKGPDATISFGSFERTLSQGGAGNDTRADGSVRFILASFWANVKDDLHLGKYGENWMSLPEIVPSVPRINFFSYNSLSQIIWQTPAIDQKVRELEERLKWAEAARLHGDRAAEQAAMKGFLDSVAAGAAGKPPAITAPGAQVLTSMGSAMYPY